MQLTGKSYLKNSGWSVCPEINEDFTLFSGGQFGPKQGGQFAPTPGGQFEAKQGGQL